MTRTRSAAALFALAILLAVVAIHAANVLLDSNMEAAGTTSWPLTNVTSVNACAKATDHSDGGQSLKCTSFAGNKVNVEWYNAQADGTINAGDTVLLSLWHGAQFNGSVAGGASGTLYADLVRSGGTATRVWSQSVTPSLTFASARVTALDISSFVTVSGTYSLRVGFTGKTGGVNTASINVWWDNVLLDVTAAVPRLTTVGDGTDPGNVAGCPVNSAQMLDAFTLQTAVATDAVSNIRVTFANGTAAALSLVEVTTDAGAQLGSVPNPPSDVVDIPVSITATTTLTQYRIRVTPKTQGTLAGTTTYNVTGRVTAITSADPKSYGDTDSATLTIDNTPPANPGWGAISSSDAQATLNWTVPGDAAQIVVIRGTTTPLSMTLAEGQSYNVNDPIGAGVVRYIGAATSFTDTPLTNGTTYYYKVFAKDGCGNYSAGVESSAVQPNAAPQTTTVGDGVDPDPVTFCPGTTAYADAFTLQTSAGTDVLASVTVALTNASAVARVEITNDSGTTAHGSLDNPGASAVVPAAITATTSLTQYKIRVTAKSHAVLAAGSLAVTANVTSVNSPDTKAYQDTDGTTVTIDNTAPGVATWATNSVANGQVILNWTRPADATEVVILRNAGPITDAPVDGSGYAQGNTIGTSVVRYAGPLLTFTDTSVVNDATYYYKLFARDGCSNYATGTDSAPLTPTDAVPRVTAGTASGTVDSCNQVTVRAPFSGDRPSNSTTTFERAPSASGPWTTACANVTGASPRTCAVSGLTGGEKVYVRVTFNDSDGVSGQNPQLAGPFTTPVVCKQASTTAGTVAAQVSACRQITVTAPFSGDGDGDGSLRVEFNTTNTWPGTVACATASGPSPRQCLVTTVLPSTSYYVRATYSDPDGVAGSAQQILGPLATPACGADAAAPMVLFLTPARDAVIGGVDRAKVQIYDAGTIGTIQWSIDGGAPATPVRNNNYNCGTGCGVYELDLDTRALANGPHQLTVTASDAAGNIGRLSQPFVVANTSGGVARGGGTLLRRTHSSQLCADCHALATHSSQSTRSSKYGNWAVDCLACHTPHLTPNIKLVRPAIVTPNSGLASITMRVSDAVGGTNPQDSLLGAYDASGAPYNDGVCESCHTKTLYHRNNATGTHTHNQGARCSGCHSHVRGFKSTNCIDCHNSPPTIGKHRVKHDEVWDSTSGNAPSAYADGASHATATQYGYACIKCHSGVHENDKLNPTRDGTQAKPWSVEVSFNGKSSTGGYSGTYNANTDIGGDGQYYSWSNGSCSNTYCHSNAAPAGGTNVPVNVTWNQATPTTCTSCHKTVAFGDGTADATALSKSHAKHIQSLSTETGTYAFKCDECHAATIRDNPSAAWSLTTADLKDKRLHVNETKNVAFSRTLLATTIDQSAGTYADETTKSCGGTYCHSPGTKLSNFDPPNFALTWGTTAGCHSCHGGNAASAAPIVTGKHTNHINNAALLGVTISCTACHDGTAASDTTISTYANHVNGAVAVSGTNAGTWTKPTCTSSRCHSSGQRLATPQYYSVTWPTEALDCKGCHGRHTDNAFASIAGEPNYTTNTTLSKYNSHRAHVSSTADCANCHAATTLTATKIDGTTPTRHLDFDGTPDVVYATKYAGATYVASSRTCSVSCHGSGAPVWGGPAMLCLDCHGAASDRDDWVINNDVPSLISTTEWTASGHGTAAIALPGTNPCLYCHASSVGHYLVANPFRLANTTGADGVNGVCLACHKTGSAGFNPGSGLKNGAKKVDSYHYATKHSTSANGGLRCWDCHDPHGDTNIKMIGRLLIKSSNDSWGLSATRTTQTIFTANTSGTNYVSTGTGITATGVCNVCHTTAGHYTATSGDTHSTAVCTTSCHKHSQTAVTDAFKNSGGGGNCLGCHGDGSGAPGRRPVLPDFADGTGPNFRSHHVGNGTANALKGTLNNFDCVVCHAEGKVVSSPTGPTTDTEGQPHGDKKIDLRNVDSTTAYFTYDKDAVKTSAGTNLAQWSSANDVWRTQTSTALDPFCLTCHDNNGASQIASLGEVGATAANPFKDTAIANNYDQLVRPGPIDVKSKVTGTGTYPDFVGGTAPPQGAFSRHAIRRQYKSVYSKYTGALTGCNGTTACKPIYDYNLFVQNGTDEFGKPNWNDTSVMGCADCHTTDGANGATGNAHGSSSEYLLKNSTGGATEGTLAGVSYVCFRCHTGDTAISGHYAGGASHADNGGDYQDYTGAVGANRVPAGNTGGSRFGMACTNCHGGAPGVGSTDGFGWIHGTSQTFYVGYTTTTKNAYRFMNGGSMRFWDPNGWNTSGGTCWTLGGTGRAADQWGGCTKHSGNAPYTRNVTRPLSY